MKGVAILFEQEHDQSTRSNDVTNNWAHPIVASIMASPTGEVTTKVNDSYAIGVGSYSFSQVSPTEYTSNYEYRTYVPGGTYIQHTLQSTPVYVSGSDFSNLDKEKYKMESFFSAMSLLNSNAKSKDDKINKEKNSKKSTK
jgi:hypothetical protein